MLALGRIFYPCRISLVCSRYWSTKRVIEAFPQGRYFLEVVRSSDEEVRSRRATPHFMGRCDRSKSHPPHDNLFSQQALPQDRLFHATSPLETGLSTPDPHEALSKLEATTKRAVSIMTDIYENTTRVYYALYEQMNEFYRKGATDIESTREAESIAHSLIKNDDLPLLIRCRALCIFGCSDQGDYLSYAEESVNYAKLGLEALASDKDADHEGDEHAQLILKCCEECLEGAQAAAAKAGSDQGPDSDDEMEDSEEPEVQEDGDEDDNDDGEGVVVWDPDWDDERKAKADADDEARIAALNSAARMAEGGDEVHRAKVTADDAK
jgi:hypothetical protein